MSGGAGSVPWVFAASVTSLRHSGVSRVARALRAPAAVAALPPGTAGACGCEPGRGSTRLCPAHTVLVVKRALRGRGHRRVPATLPCAPAARHLSLHFRVHPENRSQTGKFRVGPKLKIHEFSLNFKLTGVSFDVASVCGLYLGIRRSEIAQ